MIFIADLIVCSTCFGHHYAHHQELESIIQVVAACPIWCFGFQVVGMVWSWGLCVRFAGSCFKALKCVIAGQATEDNMAHVHCMLDTSGYEYRVRISNTYCFSTATVVATTRLDGKIYVYCLLCVIIIYWKGGVRIDLEQIHKKFRVTSFC